VELITVAHLMRSSKGFCLIQITFYVFLSVDDCLLLLHYEELIF